MYACLLSIYASVARVCSSLAQDIRDPAGLLKAVGEALGSGVQGSYDQAVGASYWGPYRILIGTRSTALRIGFDYKPYQAVYKAHRMVYFEVQGSSNQATSVVIKHLQAL